MALMAAFVKSYKVFEKVPFQISSSPDAYSSWNSLEVKLTNTSYGSHSGSKDRDVDSLSHHKELVLFSEKFQYSYIKFKHIYKQRMDREVGFYLVGNL